MQKMTKTTDTGPIPSALLSLKTKLVLSYLLVILGTVFVISIVIIFATQSIFREDQIQRLNGLASSQAAQIQHAYISNGGWPADPGRSPIINSGAPDLLIVEVASGTQWLCAEPNHSDNCNNPTVTTALTQTLQGVAVPAGTIEVSMHGDTLASLYVTAPITYNDQIIGALFLSEPPQNTPDGFISLINRAVIITGLIVACIAGLCSYLIVRRFIRPLDSLTRAALQMKEGKYTHRVEQPQSLDELGKLALTFNEMADTIETDINELRRQDQVRRDLIANIAHDLATPLTAIQGLSEALADNVVTNPVIRQETGQRINREIQRLRRLVADVRQMSSLEAGHEHLDLEPLDIKSLVDETVAVIAPECEEMGISLRNTISVTAPLVQADSDRITQVLLNLLDNARRHTPEDGNITIGAQPQGKNLSIWISDTGTGIDPVDLPHIFERFYRADRSRALATGGSGLGLSIVKAIISTHKGAIWAESQPGQGTRITFTLPSIQENRQSAPERKPTSAVKPVSRRGDRAGQASPGKKGQPDAGDGA